MSNIQEVVVHPREVLGKEAAGRLRRQGLVPSVVYGLDAEPVPVSVHPKVINKIIASEIGLNSVLDLRLAESEESRYVMIKALDRHPVTDRLVHIDFLRIDMDKQVNAVIPIETVGVPEGAKLGGVLTVVRHKLEIECLPKDLIGVIKVDVSSLGLNEALRVGDLPEYDGIRYLLDPQRTVATVRPKGEEAAAEEEEVEMDMDVDVVAE